MPILFNVFQLMLVLALQALLHISFFIVQGISHLDAVFLHRGSKVIVLLLVVPEKLITPFALYISAKVPRKHLEIHFHSSQNIE